MAAPKTQPQPNAPSAEPTYPVIERFVGKASAADVDALFDSIKQGLSELKGPRAEQAKKIRTAVQQTEELLTHLLQVREKIGKPSR